MSSSSNPRRMAHSTNNNNHEDLQQTLEKEAIKQMKKCIVPNCKSVQDQQIRLCDSCWSSLMQTCNTFDKQYEMLTKYTH